MENFLLIVIIGILLLYFFSSANVYKSLYKKVNEEKNLLNEEIEKLHKIVDRYEKQAKISSGIFRKILLFYREMWLVLDNKIKLN